MQSDTPLLLPSQSTSTELRPYGDDTVAAQLDRLPDSAYIAYMGDLAPGSRPITRSTLGKLSRALYNMGPELAPWHMMTANQFNYLKTMLIKAGLAPKTIHRSLCMVRSVLKKARSLNQIPPNLYPEYDTIMLTKNVKGSQGRGEIKPHRSLSDDEIKGLFTTLAADKSPAGLRDMAILSCLRGTGIRRMEVASLMMEDIRWGAEPHGELRLRTTKGGKVRVIPMPPGLREILGKWIEYRGDDLGCVFMALRRNGIPVRKSKKSGGDIVGFELAHLTESSEPEYSPLDRSSINRLMEKRLVLAGIQKATPHDLRYTFAQKNLRRSNLQTVADLMGHSNIATTSIYTETSREQMIATIGQEDVFNNFTSK